jgi:hypothetical protein
MKIFFLKFLLILSVVLILDMSLNGLFLSGMHTYFGLNDDTDILFVGHSHTGYGIDVDMVESSTGIKSAKYYLSGATIYTREAMINYYCANARKKPKLIIYDIEPTMFSSDLVNNKSYMDLYPFMSSRGIYEYIDKRQKDRSDLLLKNIFRLTRWKALSLTVSVRGLLGFRQVSAQGVFDPGTYDSSKYDLSIDEEALAVFLETIKQINDNGTNVVLLYIPVVDLVAENNIDDHHKFLTIMEKLSASSGGKVVFINLFDAYKSQYSLFVDETHLNKDGQDKFTRDVIDELNRLFALTQ